MTEKGIMIELV